MNGRLISLVSMFVLVVSFACVVCGEDIEVSYIGSLERGLEISLISDPFLSGEIFLPDVDVLWNAYNDTTVHSGRAFLDLDLSKNHYIESALWHVDISDMYWLAWLNITGNLLPDTENIYFSSPRDQESRINTRNLQMDNSFSITNNNRGEPHINADVFIAPSVITSTTFRYEEMPCCGFSEIPWQANFWVNGSLLGKSNSEFESLGSGLINNQVSEPSTIISLLSLILFSGFLFLFRRFKRR